MYQCYELTQKQYYFDYIKAWVDSIINEKGEIHSFCPDELDDIQPGILLFPLTEKTGDPRYDTALKTLMEILKHWKKNEVGGYWHKEECPNEMWLDGLYMGGSIQVQLAKRYHDPELMDAAAERSDGFWLCLWIFWNICRRNIVFMRKLNKRLLIRQRRLFLSRMTQEECGIR